MTRSYCVRSPMSLPIHKLLPVETEWLVWEARASQLENLRDYWLCVIAVIPILYVGWLDEIYFALLALPALAALARWFAIWRKRYQVTNRRVLVRKGNVISKELGLLDIISTRIKTPAAQKRYGRGTLRLYGSDSSRPALTLVAIPRPEVVQAKILEHAERQALGRAEAPADPEQLSET